MSTDSSSWSEFSNWLDSEEVNSGVTSNAGIHHLRSNDVSDGVMNETSIIISDWGSARGADLFLEERN